eukprot:GHRQ01023870.1.p5 GENE.GHRQ01023870.1~~GHRQ01023870.1.p5  ORF type:complete len:120 (+),score=53.18 GHRQ01023870.1:779-1138(+)
MDGQAPADDVAAAMLAAATAAAAKVSQDGLPSPSRYAPLTQKLQRGISGLAGAPSVEEGELLLRMESARSLTAAAAEAAASAAAAGVMRPPPALTPLPAATPRTVHQQQQQQQQTSYAP